ncbi:MAG: Na(+)/H(+) antiporter subunit D [Sneathiella sp.]|nr:Na(+)/H(+) antiporter subunit D [Sneathiella sp.]
MIEGLNPGLILILGALLVPFTSGFIRNIYVLALPIIGLYYTWSLGLGSFGHVEILGHTLILTKIDALARVFGTIFHIAAFAGLLYGLHVKDPQQHVATLIYAGAAIAAVFSGDLVSLFSYWELTAISSAFLIFASRNERAFNAGMRYLIIQVTSGVLLLAGIALYVAQSGNMDVAPMELGSAASWLFLIAFGIKTAFPLLHNWVQDAYPQATVSGTVILSAFTTKLAVYALARFFAGEDILLWIGAIMVIFPVFHATLENDLRRTVAYSMNSQQGFMVIGVGIGTELALNGVAAHATVSILYTCLLFMATGAVLYRAGTAKITDLGAVYKSMPLTAMFAVIGSLVIMAFPLTAAFASKSLILSAALDGKMVILWLAMLFGAVAVIDNVGLKIPLFGFFKPGEDMGLQEAPKHMLLAMGVLSVLAIGIGIFPSAFFQILPYPIEYHVYTASHVVTQLQLIIFAALVFVCCVKFNMYPKPQDTLTLDFDWFYRKPLKKFAINLGLLINAGYLGFLRMSQAVIGWFITKARETHGGQGLLSRTAASGVAVSIVMLLFGVTLLLVY